MSAQIQHAAADDAVGSSLGCRRTLMLGDRDGTAHRDLTLVESRATVRYSRLCAVWHLDGGRRAGFLGGMAAVLYTARSVAARDALKSEQAFERSSGEVASTSDASHAQFVQWVSSVRAFERYPELQGVGELVIVPASELPAFTAHTVKDPSGALAPDGSFQVIPPGVRPTEPNVHAKYRAHGARLMSEEHAQESPHLRESTCPIAVAKLY
jgi:hypothetical protein